MYDPRMAEETDLSRISALPTLDPFLGTLPPNQFPYRVTLADVHDVFVVRAPFRERREQLFMALSLYSSAIWDLLPDARLWVDGGFTTHKDWASPSDVDVAVIADKVDNVTKGTLASMGLFTMTEVSGKANELLLPQMHKLLPFGGMIDSYFTTTAHSYFYKQLWSQVKGPDGKIIEGASKGFLEVIRGLS